jgi:hypothetical protein
LVPRKLFRLASHATLFISIASAVAAAPEASPKKADTVPVWTSVPARTSTAPAAVSPPLAIQTRGPKGRTQGQSRGPASPKPTAPVTTPVRPPPPAAGTNSAARPEPPPAQVKRARDLWYRGVDAFRNGNYEVARQAFAECYQLMPKSDVLRNLSISEIHSGHYVSAARHLKQLLSAPGELPPNVRQEATTRLAQAEAQIGQLGIEVDVAGADIRVDGTLVGRSPLEGNWYVEPGQHEVVISKPGYPAERRQVFALVGVVIPINVGLEALRREQAADARAAELMGTTEGEVLTHADGRDGLSTGSTIALVTLGTIAAATLAGGIIYTVSADGHASDAESIAGNLWGTNACRGEVPEAFESTCAEIKRETDAADKDRTISLVAFTGFGVASAATLGYVLWLALDDNAVEPETATRGLAPSLSVGPDGVSVGLGARF